MNIFTSSLFHKVNRYFTLTVTVDTKTLSTFEKMLLSELMDFGVIIEDKRTDSVTLDKKEETWVMLAERRRGDKTPAGKT